MDHHRCTRFGNLRVFYPDELNTSSEREFHGNGNIRDYCPNGASGNKECSTDLDKIKAGFLLLFNQIIIKKIKSLNKEQIEMFTIHIMIWLSYMLNIKNVNEFKNINDFYDKYINNDDEYKKFITSVENDYSSFKDFINKKKELLNINFEYMSKFYDAFKLLCSMHTGFGGKTTDCTSYLEKANQFVEKYTNLNENSNNTDGSSYRQVLCTLSNDYDNFKKKYNDVNCMGIPSLPPIKTVQPHVQRSDDNYEQNSDVTSSSPILNKLILILSILVAISILGGISYKYSLFGFRKRVQKQHLRKR
ncbi:PIR protein [Plasmodium yoelii]|uniref:PIR protein n=2 Tax=Plasmodium yoelii TaxID=5861 RepID=A0AAE9WS12_PLAYO|nr:PIR protein [Plasmodium yoelii]WBY58930.1 PIR protein [Plasmodium yoelii yoelii]CDS44944.1 YIR protein [Plasmodium yoelii]VTZ79763.1 PIR protein [Plasmodium yoelii]|eukprot:XP_022812520.1 PIR protein [Plasmodium yoelii]